ncbi:polysaccharide deacetylase family protein [Salimicrobium flavidum]|uniref:Uncharacterized protein YdaL n=1 Tax=Salimicrobium flavidum TaxID=570947 RepID=A0A1N7IZL3_9BACI|nr:polysaccharide deacetylase family protein [Salimicrobium flavidum]SIS42479.1 Uncharacterized protein YdaL [Salimicrobium flavidum]
MGARIISLLILTVLFFSLIPATALAETGDTKSEVLIVFSDTSEEVNFNQRYLDMLITHFTTNLTFVHESEFSKGMLEGKTHLFYQGITESTISTSFRNSVETFDGPVVAIGRNFDHLSERFSFVTPLQDELSETIYLNDSPEEKISVDISVNSVQTNSEVLATAENNGKEFPLITSDRNSYYVGNNNLESSMGILLGEILHDIFPDAHKNEKNRGYIRLEDVHPNVEHEKLKQVADSLIKRDLPFMIAVIPVYTDPKTGVEYHMSDYPKVLEVLKYMQDNGGSVVMHGYTHQYRSSETGEGFEFWDVENDSPIYQSADEVTELKTEKDFSNSAKYEQYKQDNIDFETRYIEDKLETGINELNGFGLKPLAFEAPHYTISQNGYNVVSNHFNSYIGQAQVTDDNWEVMGSPPYMSEPTFMHGMKMYPETIGYVQPDDKKAIDKMITKAENQLILRDGMVSLFYHPYLGPERFEELLNRLEELPPIDWIDLKEENTRTQSSEVLITASGDEIQSNGGPFSSSFTSFITMNHFIQGLADKATWLIVGTSSLAVLFFSGYTIISRRRVEKEERSEDLG